MPKIELDVTQAKALEPLPPGLYPVVIQQARLDESSTGKPMLVLDFEVTDGDHVGRHVFTNVVLTKEADWRIKQLLDAAGVYYDADGFDSDELLGRSLVVRVGIEVYEGQARNRVSAFHPTKK